MDTQNSSISSLQFETDSNSNAIASIQTQIDNINNSIASIQSDLTNVSNVYTNLELTVQQNTTSIQNTTSLTTIESTVSTLEDSLEYLQGELETLTESLSTTTGDVSSNTTSITTLQNDVSTNLNNYTNLETEVTDLESDILTLNNSFSAIESDYITNEHLESLHIRVDTTWAVGPSSDADYTTLHDALTASYDYTIDPNATLTLQLEEGTHIYTNVLEINHQQGERIEIVGDIQSPETYVLEYSGEVSYGIILFRGKQLGALKGITLRGDGTSTQHGLFTQMHSSVIIQDIIVENWTGSGIFAQYNSLILSSSGTVEVRNNTTYGLISQLGSIVRINELQSHNNAYGADVSYGSTLYVPYAQVYENSGFGLSASWSSSLIMHDGYSNDNGTNGYQVSYGAVANLLYSEAIGNSIFGYNAFNGGIILAQESLSSNNLSHGYAVGNMSWIQAYAAQVSGNGTDYNTGTTDNGSNSHITQ